MAAGGYGTAFVMRLGPTATAVVAASRVISYTYDGLARLTQATEQPGISTTDGYDLAGNRTQVKVNNQITAVRAYNAANQVVGWQYDAAGNLLSDGTTTSTYDSLNRTLTTAATGQARTMRYNDDGTLVGQLANGDAITYTQDLASPLSQILQLTQGGTTHYPHGRGRLAAVANSTCTCTPATRWAVYTRHWRYRHTVNYDAWGTPENGTVPTFGFTGELQDARTGLVNLRARWYSAGSGTFTSRDSFAGNPETPYSQNPYAYALGNPVLRTDPAGTCSVDDTGGPRACHPTHTFEQELRAFITDSEIYDRYLTPMSKSRGYEPLNLFFDAHPEEALRYHPPADLAWVERALATWVLDYLHSTATR